MNKNTNFTGINIFSILLIPIVWFFCSAVVAPALGAISQNFPEASAFQIKMVICVTSITSVIFSIISGKLAKYFDKKNIIMLGLFIYGVTGISTTFATNVTQIIIIRLITGIGVGLVLPLPCAIISEKFDGDKRTKLLGLCTATANVANVATSIIGGIIVVFGWKYPFYSFALSFVLVLTTFIGLPKCPPIKEEIKINENIKKEKLNISIYILGIFMALVWITHITLTSNLSIFCTKEKIGEAEMIGLLLGLPGIASIVAGCLSLQLTKLFKKYLSFVALIMFAIGFAVLYKAYSVPAIVIGDLIEGFGFGILVPMLFDLTAQKANYNQQDEASGFVSSCMHLGSFLSPFVQAMYTTIGHNSTERFIFFSSATAVSISALIVLVVLLLNKSKKGCNYNTSLNN